MRLGVRSQVALALGAIVALTFGPLYVAVANLTRAALADAGARPALARPLLSLVAMYGVGFGVVLVAFTHAFLTRVVVRPIVDLSGAARRVAEGARRFEAEGRGPAEIADLASSIAEMTARLRQEEEALRAKIEETERYAADLKAAQERLVRSERLASVGRLAAGLAHEIGNPISAIMGFQDLLLGGGLSADESNDFVVRMKRETERIHRVLRDLLDFARPASARDRVVEECRLADAVDDAAALVRPQKDWRDVSLTVELAPDVPALAITHERLVQVMLNLLLNAGDAAPRPGGIVRISARKQGENKVEIAVEDNGPGVAPEVMDRLFEPFVTTKDVGKGTGLGLAVCRGLVESAGGNIAVETSPLGGARLVLEIPVFAEERS